ncbi:alcohol dehydrogenase 1-like isoform X3 [Malus domestica]|uniref:alcohol dehydrogenase 1-like isoform X3 n=2 Tax=Malus domestica TaxID=3750 RepID=UPI0010AAD06C|nr:alcohol dehydrogenase 1-like [Malus domestica]
MSLPPISPFFSILLHYSLSAIFSLQAAMAWEAGKPLSIEEVEVAPPQKHEVRLKILFTSLCHTDVYVWEAKGQQPLFPRIFGHEAGGEGVTELQLGDHVLPVFTGECKECVHCKSKESNMCDLLRINTDRGTMINDGQSRFSKDGKPIYHFLGFGATVNVAKPKKGSSIAIFGLGAVGLAAAEGARVSGCSRI